ncbi:MerR family transcriptional regulator [Actinoallomurus iriomotensis]|uniref:MerR family transcriptional regulator n=1 Tax=Actinoallomurus iriomotensis TaxID=478107 RepID=A0A9W6S5J7_9ACTN|nr:MerR family transcriptional regulator [Actinoallomurus iriomotensis]GLY88725.1 MerR family transcriptional regulator [Actinoallomurus iriomotensis]
MRIGALAQRTGVSRRLLRYYEEQGLLRPRRLANGYREFAESDVTAVRHIRDLLAAGLPTTVIARLLDCVHDDGERLVPSSCPGMVTDLRRERHRIAEAITRLQSSQQALDTMLAAALGQPGFTDASAPSRTIAPPRGGEGWRAVPAARPPR